MKSNKEEFSRWAKRQKLELFDKLSDVMPDCKVDLQVGQECTFVNYCMTDFPGHTIMGFCNPTSWGGCVYLDYDCYWYPTEPDKIFLDGEFGKNGNIEIVQDKNCTVVIINRIRCVVQSYKADEWVNLSPVQTGMEAFEERLDNIRIDFVKNEITTDGKKSIKWHNFSLTIDPMRINEILKTG